MHVYVSGLDLATLGVQVADVAGDLDASAPRPPGVALPFAPGERLSGAAPAVAPRVVTVTGTLTAPSPAALRDRWEALLAALRVFAGGLASGPVALSVVPRGATAAGVATPATALRPGAGAFPGAATLPGGTAGGVGAPGGELLLAPDRAWTAYADQPQAVRLGSAAVATRATVTLRFVCPDPYAYDLVDTVVALGGADARVPALGTAPAWPVLELDGPFTARTYHVGNNPGGVYVEHCRGTITAASAAGGVPAGARVELDFRAQTVTYVTAAGARSAVAAWLSHAATSRPFAALDPARILPGYALGDPAGTPYAALEGGGSGRLRYRRAWR